MKKEIVCCSLIALLGALSADGQQAPAAAPRAPLNAPSPPLNAPNPPLTAAPSGSPTLPAPPTLPAQPTLPTRPATTPEVQGLPPGSNVLGMFTNTALATNFFLTNQIFAIQDQAVTIPDQRLLVQIRVRAEPIMRNFLRNLAFIPVHFLVQQNVVTVVGQVVAEPQKQQIIEVVQHTPGVVQVVDKLTVNPQLNLLGLAAGGTNSAVMRFGTNFSPTGFTNGVNRVFGTNSVLPPALQGAQQLPPAGSQ